MINRLIHKISQRYASKWLILFLDIMIVIFTYFIAHIIRYNFQIDFDVAHLVNEIPFVFFGALISFLLVGSHKGVVRFTGFKDIVNIIIGTKFN